MSSLNYHGQAITAERMAGLFQDRGYSLEAWDPGDLIPHIENTIAALAPYTFPDKGLDNYRPEQLLDFLLDDTQFSLSLNRQQGRNILYGQAHVQLRRDFFNQCPLPLRLQMGRRKLQTLGPVHFKGESIFDSKWVDVQDLGMGTSVYYLEREHPSDSKLVLKQGRDEHQGFYAQVLGQLGWPSYDVEHQDHGPMGLWVSTYLGGEHIQPDTPLSISDESLVTQLAKHACLGDVLGRGDRHLENYLVLGGQVYALDISHIFWPDNEYWTENYLKGGVYEYNYLISVQEDPERYQALSKLFFDTYETTATELQAQHSRILSCIQIHYPYSWEGYEAYILKRYSSEYRERQKKRYVAAMHQVLQEQSYRDLLASIDPDQLQTHSTLYMYYLSHQSRFSSFLHLDESLKPALFKQIEALAEAKV